MHVQINIPCIKFFFGYLSSHFVSAIHFNINGVLVGLSYLYTKCRLKKQGNVRCNKVIDYNNLLIIPGFDMLHSQTIP